MRTTPIHYDGGLTNYPKHKIGAKMKVKNKDVADMLNEEVSTLVRNNLARELAEHIVKNDLMEVRRIDYPFEHATQFEVVTVVISPDEYQELSEIKQEFEKLKSRLEPRNDRETIS